MGLFAPLQRSRFDPERRMFDGEAGEAASKRHTPSPKPLGERRPRGGLGEEDLIPDGYTTWYWPFKPLSIAGQISHVIISTRKLPAGTSVILHYSAAWRSRIDPSGLCATVQATDARIVLLPHRDEQQFPVIAAN